MKKPKPFFAAFLFSLCLLFIRCSSDKAGLLSSTEEVLVKHIWAVDYYFNNQDMTGAFSSSRLLFSSTGAVGYQRNGETIAGRWSVKFDATNNEWVDLQFDTSNSDVNRLNESWKLTDRSPNSLQFEGNSTSDVLLRIRAQ